MTDQCPSCGAPTRICRPCTYYEMLDAIACAARSDLDERRRVYADDPDLCSGCGATSKARAVNDDDYAHGTVPLKGEGDATLYRVVCPDCVSHTDAHVELARAALSLDTRRMVNRHHLAAKEAVR